MPAAPRTNRRRHLLVVISSHGYGHAMPTAAVLNSLKALATDVDLTLMTTVPRSILSQRIEGEFDLIERSVEFGMRMASPFDVLVRESTDGYVEIIESWDKLVDREAFHIDEINPDFMLSNISFLSIAGAKRAGRRCAAMCSFTWADVFRSYCGHASCADEVLTRLWASYNEAEIFLHAEPGTPMLEISNLRRIGPIGTTGINKQDAIRAHLNLDNDARIVVCDLGGIMPGTAGADLPQIDGLHWLIAGEPEKERFDVSQISRLNISHLDAVASADAIVTKPGYGTFVEACCSGTRVLYVEREVWPEEPYLIPWLRLNGCCAGISRESWETAAYGPELIALCEQEIPNTPLPTGNQQAATLLSDLMK